MLRIAIRLLFFGSVTCLMSHCTSNRNIDQSSGTDLPFRISVIKGSNEKVMTQTLPWEEQMMGYFKVLKTGPDNWQMWYSSWDNKRKDDYSGFLVYASSKDGKNWKKEIPGQQNNILRGTGHPQKDGIVEQDVILEPLLANKYRMIYTAKDPEDHGKEKTYVEESSDGIKWDQKKECR